ncbi:MAG: glycosyl transferase, partial [Lysobacter sp.]|nr:glycosyl transferase [Lysobacter sp.]
MSAIAGLMGARLVYDIDDNLLDMDEHGEGFAYRDLRSAVARSLQVADTVWCSTSALAERLSPVAGGAVSVLPNALDPRIWTRVPPPTIGGRPVFRLLYMGTRTHDEDFAFLCRVMASLEALLPGRFRLTLVGVCQNPPVEAPWLELHGPPAEVGASYPAFVHWLQQQHGFDLGVAPLVSGPFNDCKSPIKVMDYAAMGLPALASRVP